MAPIVVPADAGVVVPDAMQVSDACQMVGVRVAEIEIAEADPAERTMVEQQRAANVRHLAEACTSQGWGDELRSCVLAAKKKADLAKCENVYLHPPAQPRPPGNPDVIEKAPETHDPKATPKLGDTKAPKGEPKAVTPKLPKTPKAKPKTTEPKAGSGSGSAK